MTILKLLLLTFLIYLIHRFYLAYKLIKKIRDEVIIKGKSYQRYSYDSTSSSAESEGPSTAQVGDAIEAEYKVIK